MASVILDNRKLHVSTAYTKWENVSPAEIFKQTSDRIREKYLRQAGVDGGGSFTEGQKLNEFFQALKILQRDSSSDFIEQSKAEVILNVLSKARALAGNHRQYFLNVKNVNKKIQGDAAERDVAIIMQAVFDEASGGKSSGDFNKLILGSELVNVNFSGASGMNIGKIGAGLDKFAQEMVKAGAKKLHDKVLQGRHQDKFTAVQGKIDVSGATATVEFDISANNYLLEIAQLLKKASFSIKSYSSQSFDKELEQKIASKITKLHLGHTDQKRIFLDILQQEGVPQDVALSMLYYAKNTKTKKVKQYANNLIFAYELTGYGQKYVNKAIQEVLDEYNINGANYFIYNDPATNDIHVVSTAHIIATMWNKVDDLLNKGATSLQKSFFNFT